MANELREGKNELQTKNKAMDDMGIKNQDLNQKIAELELNEKSFKVYEEKLVFHPNLLLPQTMNIKKIKALLGEPLKTEEDIEAHAPGKSIKLIYNQGAFIFNSNKGKETIKAYTIKDASFSSNRGISVGSTRDEVLKAYDKSYYNFFENKGEITFGDKTGMSFKLQNDKVNEFSVWFVYE